MNRTFGIAAASIALALAGCGDGADNATTAASGNGAAPITAPAGSNWTSTVSATDDGGFVMGNPDAPIKLVEYLSLTCHVCAQFAETGYVPLRDNYVAKGTVSLEIRNYVRDPVDVTAALLTRCNGAAPYFQLTEQVLASQEEILGRAQSLTDAELQRISALPPTGQFGAFAEATGLDQFFRQRGVSADKASACLSNQASVDQLVAMQQRANDELKIPGTPTFFINGEMQNVTAWPQLEEALKAAGA